MREIFEPNRLNLKFEKNLLNTEFGEKTKFEDFLIPKKQFETLIELLLSAQCFNFHAKPLK